MTPRRTIARLAGNVIGAAIVTAALAASLLMAGIVIAGLWSILRAIA